MIRGTVGIWMLAFFENCITWIIKLRSVAIRVLDITGLDSRLSFQWKHNLHLCRSLLFFTCVFVGIVDVVVVVAVQVDHHHHVL